jgi:hypothetical protein
MKAKVTLENIDGKREITLSAPDGKSFALSKLEATLNEGLPATHKYKTVGVEYFDGDGGISQGIWRVMKAKIKEWTGKFKLLRR